MNPEDFDQPSDSEESNIPKTRLGKLIAALNKKAQASADYWTETGYDRKNRLNKNKKLSSDFTEKGHGRSSDLVRGTFNGLNVQDLNINAANTFIKSANSVNTNQGNSKQKIAPEISSAPNISNLLGDISSFNAQTSPNQSTAIDTSNAQRFFSNRSVQKDKPIRNPDNILGTILSAITSGFDNLSKQVSVSNNLIGKLIFVKLANDSADRSEPINVDADSKEVLREKNFADAKQLAVFSSINDNSFTIIKILKDIFEKIKLISAGYGDGGTGSGGGGGLPLLVRGNGRGKNKPPREPRKTGTGGNKDGRGKPRGTPHGTPHGRGTPTPRIRGRAGVALAIIGAATAAGAFFLGRHSNSDFKPSRGSDSESELPSSAGTPVTSGTPGIPGAPGIPGSPGGLGAPGIPGTPGPVTSGSPGAPVTPVTPVTPGTPAGTPVTPGSPVTPVSPGTPAGTPVTPVTPVTPGSPVTPVTPGPVTPGGLGTPGIPDALGALGTGALILPFVSRTPRGSGRSGAPGPGPVTSGSPTPRPVTPVTPGTPGPVKPEKAPELARPGFLKRAAHGIYKYSGAKALVKGGKSAVKATGRVVGKAAKKSWEFARAKVMKAATAVGNKVIMPLGELVLGKTKAKFLAGAGKTVATRLAKNSGKILKLAARTAGHTAGSLVKGVKGGIGGLSRALSIAVPLLDIGIATLDSNRMIDDAKEDLDGGYITKKRYNVKTSGAHKSIAGAAVGGTVGAAAGGAIVGAGLGALNTALAVASGASLGAAAPLLAGLLALSPALLFGGEVVGGIAGYSFGQNIGKDIGESLRIDAQKGHGDENEELTLDEENQGYTIADNDYWSAVVDPETGEPIRLLEDKASGQLANLLTPEEKKNNKKVFTDGNSAYVIEASSGKDGAPQLTKIDRQIDPSNPLLAIAKKNIPLALTDEEKKLQYKNNENGDVIDPKTGKIVRSHDTELAGNESPNIKGSVLSTSISPDQLKAVQAGGGNITMPEMAKAPDMAALTSGDNAQKSSIPPAVPALPETKTASEDTSTTNKIEPETALTESNIPGPVISALSDAPLASATHAPPPKRTPSITSAKAKPSLANKPSISSRQGNQGISKSSTVNSSTGSVIAKSLHNLQEKGKASTIDIASDNTSSAPLPIISQIKSYASKLQKQPESHNLSPVKLPGENYIRKAAFASLSIPKMNYAHKDIEKNIQKPSFHIDAPFGIPGLASNALSHHENIGTESASNDNLAALPQSVQKTSVVKQNEPHEASKVSNLISTLAKAYHLPSFNMSGVSNFASHMAQTVPTNHMQHMVPIQQLLEPGMTPGALNSAMLKPNQINAPPSIGLKANAVYVESSKAQSPNKSTDHKPSVTTVNAPKSSVVNNNIFMPKPTRNPDSSYQAYVRSKYQTVESL